MKKLILSIALFAGFVLTTTIHAQVGAGNPTSGMNKALMKIFGKNTSFSANADITISDAKSDKQTTAILMKMAYLEGKIRADLDMANMKSADVPPEAVEQMKQMGMDKMSTIVLPDAKKMLLIYPSFKGYAEMPVGSDDVAALDKEPKIEKTALGKETVDGHPTVKNKVIITDETGKTQEMIIWNATDLKDFPVKMEMTENGNKVVTIYKDVKLAKPDASLFEPPKDFKKYDSAQQMIMQKMLGQ